MVTNICYRFLTASQVKRLYTQHIATSSPTQPIMLESAIDSPLNHKRYGQTDLFQLAGVLAEKVILNHPYQDGNKRTALFAADMFLKMNGYQLQKKPMGKNDTELNQGLANAHVLVATSQWTSEDLGNYYASVARPLEDVSGEISEYSKDAVEC
ncbi:DOC family protein [Metarhizium guizhouense ARSEF 977]|uniref:DOC family protein n=1 Tax=Metarhizium guizhouense (strain ARSEF 977) TaxID=1276136 RepID=A0A0B4GQ91_METGA|nr:DOC family protein [Metarhizium guizhouense ARSEF 977]